MLSTKRIWTAFAVVLLASSAISQAGRVVGDDPDHLGGKTKPTVADTGYALCFGDGTGIRCPNGNMGDKGHGCDNSIGTGGGLMWARGEASVLNDGFRLFVHGMPRKATVLYMQGMLPENNGKGRVFGDGLLCVGGPLVRLGVEQSVHGRGQFPPLSLYKAPGGRLSELGGIPARGGTRYYQAFYRDRQIDGKTMTFNTTNAWMQVWSP